MKPSPQSERQNARLASAVLLVGTVLVPLALAAVASAPLDWWWLRQAAHHGAALVAGVLLLRRRPLWLAGMVAAVAAWSVLDAVEPLPAGPRAVLTPILHLAVDALWLLPLREQFRDRGSSVRTGLATGSILMTAAATATLSIQGSRVVAGGAASVGLGGLLHPAEALLNVAVLLAALTLRD